MCIIFSVKMTNINIPNNQKDMLEKKLKQYQFYQIKPKKKSQIMLQMLLHLPKNFTAQKNEVDKLGSNKLTNVPTSLNNLKTKVDDLDVGKLKTVPVDLKTLTDVVDNQVAKNIKLNTQMTKINN